MKKIIKQEQWVMLPTDKAENSIITYNGIAKKMLSFEESLLTQSYLKSELKESHHLYLTSDEEIKEGDWCYNTSRNILYKAEGDDVDTSNDAKWCYKIIATTDKSLLTCNGVKREGESCSYNNNCKYPNCKLPQIPESFIKYYVEKQGEVGDVEIELEKDNYYYNTRIIIPKEEEKMYSRDEVYSLLHKLHFTDLSNVKLGFERWIKENL